MIWQAVKVMAPVVLGKYQDVTDDYFMTAFGTKDRQPRWEICIGSTLGAFGYALSRSFVEEVYDRTAKTMVRINLELRKITLILMVLKRQYSLSVD